MHMQTIRDKTACKTFPADSRANVFTIENAPPYRGRILHGTRLWFSEINAKKLLAENLAALQGADKWSSQMPSALGKRCLIVQSAFENLPIKIEDKTVARYPRQGNLCSSRGPFLEGSHY